MKLDRNFASALFTTGQRLFFEVRRLVLTEAPGRAVGVDVGA
jgi:hypothetical protein